MTVLTYVSRFHSKLEALADVFTFWRRVKSPRLVTLQLSLPHQATDVVQLQHNESISELGESCTYHPPIRLKSAYFGKKQGL